MAPWLRRSGDVELRTAGGALIGLGTAQRTQPQPLALALALALTLALTLALALALALALSGAAPWTYVSPKGSDTTVRPPLGA